MVSLVKQQARVIYKDIPLADIALVLLTSFLQMTVSCFAGQPLRSAR